MSGRAHKELPDDNVVNGSMAGAPDIIYILRILSDIR